MLWGRKEKQAPSCVRKGRVMQGLEARLCTRSIIGSFEWCSENSLQEDFTRWTLKIEVILSLVCDIPNQTFFSFMHPARGQNCAVVIVTVIEISWYKFYLCLQDFEANEDLNSIVQHSLTTYEKARYVRLIPTGHNTYPCVRVEIYVISWKSCFNGYF